MVIKRVIKMMIIVLHGKRNNEYDGVKIFFPC